MSDDWLTNIFVFSPFVCIGLIFLIISQSNKIDKLKRKINLTDFPEKIKLEQEKHSLEAQKIKAEINKINLDIEKRVREGEFHLKVLRKPFGNCIKSMTSNYIWLRFTKNKIEIINSTGLKAEINAEWTKL